jgi:hypothetical protein
VILLHPLVVEFLPPSDILRHVFIFELLGVVVFECLLFLTLISEDVALEVLLVEVVVYAQRLAMLSSTSVR